MTQRYFVEIPIQNGCQEGSLMENTQTLEQFLADRIQRKGVKRFVVQMLRDQIAAQSKGKSAHDTYVTGSVKRENNGN